MLDPTTVEVLSSSIGLSVDELAALGRLYGSPPLLALAEDGDDRGQSERDAAAEAGFRSMLARRALLVDADSGGEPELLEPYVAYLEPLLVGGGTLRLQHTIRGAFHQRLFFLHAPRVVELIETLPGVFTLSLTPAEALRTSIDAFVGLAESASEDVAGSPVEVDVSALERADAMIADGDIDQARAVLGDDGAKAFELLFAKISWTRAVVTRPVSEDGTVEVDELTWLDAGELGLWLVEGAVDLLGDATETAKLVPVASDELSAALATYVSAMTAAT